MMRDHTIAHFRHGEGARRTSAINRSGYLRPMHGGPANVRASVALCILFAAGCGDGAGGWLGEGTYEAGAIPPGAVHGVISYHGSQGIGETHRLMVGVIPPGPMGGSPTILFDVNMAYSDLDAGYWYTTQFVTPGVYYHLVFWWDLDDDGDYGSEPHANPFMPGTPGICVGAGMTRFDIELTD